MSDDRTIGRGRCPACGSDQARLAVSGKNRLAYLMCPVPRQGGCGLQVFSRSDVSDPLVRAWHVPEPAPAPAPEPAPSPAPTPEPAPAPARAPSFFGF